MGIYDDNDMKDYTDSAEREIKKATQEIEDAAIKTTISILLRVGKFKEAEEQLTQWIQKDKDQNGYCVKDMYYWLRLLARKKVKIEEELCELCEDMTEDEDYLFATEYPSVVSSEKAKRQGLIAKAKENYLKNVQEERKNKEKEIKFIKELFKFNSNGDGTCEIVEIKKDKVPSVLDIPAVSSDGETVTAIKEGLFSECDSLTSITIPDSITSIGKSALDGCLFWQCKHLSCINVDENNPTFKSIDGNLYSKDGKTLIRYAPGKKATNFNFPKGVVNISAAAFQACESLTRVVIPDDITVIERCMFHMCGSLTSVMIPNGVTSIGERAFYNCNISIITIPEGVTTIGEYAFAGCSNLTSITLPNSFKNVENGLFGSRSIFDQCTPIEMAKMPAMACSSIIAKDKLKMVEITSGDEIEDGAFKGCINLTTVKLPEGLKRIGKSAFSNCINLTNITIPDSVTSIDRCAFGGENCRIPMKLKSITFGENSHLKSIGEDAFWGCKELKNITIPNSVTSIEKWPFSCVENASGPAIMCSHLGSDIKTVNITGGNVIEDRAFSQHHDLESVTMCDSITRIEEQAFDGCYRLSSVLMSKNLTSIGSYAFSGCGSLTNIIIPDRTKQIGYMAFCECSKLSRVTIGSGVETLGEDLFNGCVNLTTIIYNGTKRQWDLIEKGWDWNYKVPARHVQCIDGYVQIKND